MLHIFEGLKELDSSIFLFKIWTMINLSVNKGSNFQVAIRFIRLLKEIMKCRFIILVICLVLKKPYHIRTIPMDFF